MAFGREALPMHVLQHVPWCSVVFMGPLPPIKNAHFFHGGLVVQRGDPHSELPAPSTGHCSRSKGGSWPAWGVVVMVVVPGGTMFSLNASSDTFFGRRRGLYKTTLTSKLLASARFFGPGVGGREQAFGEAATRRTGRSA